MLNTINIIICIDKQTSDMAHNPCLVYVFCSFKSPLQYLQVPSFSLMWKQYTPKEKCPSMARYCATGKAEVHPQYQVVPDNFRNTRVWLEHLVLKTPGNIILKWMCPSLYTSLWKKPGWYSNLDCVRQTILIYTTRLSDTRTPDPAMLQNGQLAQEFWHNRDLLTYVTICNKTF